MKRILLLAATAILMTACAANKPQEAKVMARFVPERADDFVWENNLICYRAYGKALEQEMVSPGFDVWVKLPGALVANQRYIDDLQNHKSYHKNWGNGKDCYKVGVTLGAGASGLVINDKIVYPATNYRSYEILKESPGKVVFVLHYPEWEADGEKISLDKKFTIIADSYFCKVEDTYTFSGKHGSELPVAAGIVRHDVVTETFAKDRLSVWEHASDTGAEPEDGLIGLSICMPGADKAGLSQDEVHSICIKEVKSGKPVTYYFGSCWSKADIKTAEDWIKLTDSFKPF